MTTTAVPPLCVQKFPLAAEQRGIWFVQQLAPECGAYHLVFSFCVTRSGDWPAALPGLLAGLIEDYPILRTGLPATASGPQQWVWNTVIPDVRFQDARGLGVAALRERLRDETRQPFDLARPPLWRLHCHQTGAQEWTVAVVAHHALLDFWSLGLLLQEVAARLGMTDSSPAVLDGIGFGNYAATQLAGLSDSAGFAASSAYWIGHLQDAPAMHGLPLDLPRPSMQTYAGRSLPFRLPLATSDGLRQLARTTGTTPFMVLLAAYYVLLHRFAGDTDLVVLTPVAGRLQRAQRTMLGQFVNTLALRARIDPAAQFTDLLATVKDTVINGLRHQQTPFSWLVQELSPQRDASYGPLSQIGFAWERLPLLADFADFFLAEPADVAFAGPGFKLRPYPLPQQEGQLDLMLEMGGERDGMFVGTLKYHEQLFHKETADELLQAFVCLTGAIVASPDSRIADFSLADPGRMAVLLQSGFGPRLPLADVSALALIRTQAALTPDAIAVSDQMEQLNYRTLIARADHLAYRLGKFGVEQEDRVGLMLERSCHLVTAILGIWSAGAAYVPMEPTFPPDRLADIAADAGLSVLVSESGLFRHWPVNITSVCIDLPLTAREESFAPITGATAYLLYTSGSTGKPKGVRVGHRSVLNFLQSMQLLLSLRPDSRLLAITTPAFDISVLELLLPLMVGATVVVCPRETSMDGMKLASCLRDERIDMMQATPSTWKLLVDSGWLGLPGLTALCGGDTLSQALADSLFQRVGQLWNIYGPTETTVWSSAVRLQAGEPIHLGYPIANTQLYVLDENQMPVVLGIAGELWIGGDGLALDYWHRPELTERHFRHLPTLPQAGRLYRTGDRVRRTGDGRLLHLGRLDFQVKLRGYRIELGEIESVLRGHPGIRDAVAIVREDRAGDQRLVAYLVGEQSADDVLDAALRKVLPAYMAPSAYVFLEALPQTPNRKINRNGLPAPDLSGAHQNFIAPRDAVEIRLTILFAELLGLSHVGIDDDFFALGGHSLLAVQLVSTIERQFGVALPVSSLMQHATVATLAACLRGESGVAPSMLLTLRPGHGTQPLWLFHPIGGNAFCYLELTRRLDSRRPVLAFQAPGLDAEGEAEVTVEAMARRYLALLRTLQPSGPYLLGGWCFGGVIAFEVARQLRDAGETVDGLVLIDTRAPIAANIPHDADDATLLSWFARDLAAPFEKSLTIEPETLRGLAPESMFAHVLSAAMAIGVLPADADAERLQRYFEVYLANGIALQTYFPPPDDLPLLLLRAKDEPDDFGLGLGWPELAPSSLAQVDLAGNHNSIMHAPQASAVATAIDVHFCIKPMPGFTS